MSEIQMLTRITIEKTISHEYSCLKNKVLLFRIVEAEWPQCRRCQALSYWGSGNLEWVG
jgi:hypothetical protein